jgi:hypothetical protein
MKDLPYSIFVEGEQIAAFANVSDALNYARVRSRGGGLAEVREKGGIVTQYRHGNPLTKDGKPMYAAAEASAT